MQIIGFDQGTGPHIAELAADGRLRPLAEREAFWRNPAQAMSAPAAPWQSATGAHLVPAIANSARVICIGLNYRDHAAEMQLAIPEKPVVFARWAKSLAVEGTPCPAVEARFDWEVELGAVLGAPLHHATAEQARAAIFGYFAFNDLSARSYQNESAQWTLGKNTPASGPMSPVRTADEVADPQNLRLTTRVNDRLAQDGTTANMIFPLVDLLVYLSRFMPLEPGDAIVTGTPAGVGNATGTFLVPGDVVEVEVAGVGKVKTPIIAP